MLGPDNYILSCFPRFIISGSFLVVRGYLRAIVVGCIRTDGELDAAFSFFLRSVSEVLSGGSRRPRGMARRQIGRQIGHSKSFVV